MWSFICDDEYAALLKKFLSVLLESEGERETEGDLSDISSREMAFILRHFCPFQ